MAAALPAPDALGSVVLRLTGHSWVNIAHGAVLGGLFLLAIVATTVTVLQTREGDLTAEGLEASARRLSHLALAMVVIGWTAVLTGTFVVDVWFHAASPFSAESLLAGSRTYSIWASRLLPVKEWVSWAAAAAATAAALLAYRQRWRLARHTDARRGVLALLVVSLSLAGIAGALGVLLTKLAPLM